MDNRIESIEKNILNLNQELKDIKDLLSSGLTKVAKNFDSIINEINLLNKKVDLLDSKVDNLKGATSDGLESVGFKLETLTDEIVKIGEVTKYSEQYENIKGLN